MAFLHLLPLCGALALLPAFSPWPSPKEAPDSSASPPTMTRVTVAAVMTEPDRGLRYLWTWARVGPALSLALEALQPQLHEAGLAVRTVYASPDLPGRCSNSETLLKAAQLRVSHDPDLLLGLGCLYPDFTLQRWAASVWHLPLLTAGAAPGDRQFSTTVFAGPTRRADPDAFMTLLQRHFNWTSRAAFAFSGHQTRDSYPYDRHEKLLPGAPNFTAPKVVYDQPDEAVQFLRANGRVVYISESLERLQQIMRLAEAQNMTNGDYIFFYLDVFGKSLEAEGHREAVKPWQSKEGQDVGGLREAFQTVLLITFSGLRSPEFRRFQRQLILRAQKDFRVALSDSLYKNLVAGCFHDGLLLYLRALIETLHEGGTKRDTSRILEKMRGLKIQGVTGTMSINSKNERQMDFDLWSMADVESGEYQVVGHYFGSEKRIEWMGPIHWKKGGPPLDNPPCIFNMADPSCGEENSIVDLWKMRHGVLNGAFRKDQKAIIRD